MSMDLAAIQYVGIAGGSKDCQDSVLRFIQFRDHLERVRILTGGRDHCLLITLAVGDMVAVKSGFASGYGGEGPRRFSYVLRILQDLEVDIEEVEVSSEMMNRLDESSLTQRDIELIEQTPPKRHANWHEYISDRHERLAQVGTLWQQEFPLVVPFAVIDQRLHKLAISFWKDPDASLLTAYRRLEDIVRARTGLDEYGVKLFSQAFNPDNGKLTWAKLDKGERVGRMQLFTGTYSAHRNNRAHRESATISAEALSELLLVNHLYGLEEDAVEMHAATAE